jgi:hypothetical protein
MDGTTTNHEHSCLTRTCLKWTADGELAALDLQLVLERLAAVDQLDTWQGSPLDCSGFDASP